MGADNTGVTNAIDETGGNDGTLIGFDLTGTQTVNNGTETRVVGTWTATPCSAPLYTPPSDPEFVVGTLTAGPNNTVVLPISVNNFTGMATFQGSITFDPGVLSVSSVLQP